MARLGILGGTFNPPHIGHLVCAQSAREQLGLDCVTLLPAARPPHKVVHDDPGIEVRVELCRLAAAGEPGLEVSELEARRPGPSYTVDTLQAIHDEHPEHDLTLIVGGDMAASLGSWREPERLLSLARLAVAERAGAERTAVESALGELPAAGARVDFFAMPRLDVSSSDLRARAAAGRSLRHLVPGAVADAIVEQGLYRAGAPA